MRSVIARPASTSGHAAVIAQSSTMSHSADGSHQHSGSE